MIAKPQKQQPITGPAMRQILLDAGVDAQQVTLKRESGAYVAEFYHDKMQTPVKPARMWGEMIEERLYDAEIIDCHDTVAKWRVGKPVIWASVTFRVRSG